MSRIHRPRDRLRGRCARFCKGVARKPGADGPLGRRTDAAATRGRYLRNFLAELKRRNVVRVAVSYLAAAWLVIQLVNEIGGILDAPPWLPRLVLGLLAAGFVIAVVLSWIFEFTNRGIRTTAEVDRDSSLRPIDRRKWDYFIIGALLLAPGYFVWES